MLHNKIVSIRIQKYCECIRSVSLLLARMCFWDFDFAAGGYFCMFAGLIAHVDAHPWTAGCLGAHLGVCRRSVYADCDAGGVTVATP